MDNPRKSRTLHTANSEEAIARSRDDWPEIYLVVPDPYHGVGHIEYYARSEAEIRELVNRLNTDRNIRDVDIDLDQGFIWFDAMEDHTWENEIWHIYSLHPVS